jgi:hypothetical protein
MSKEIKQKLTDGQKDFIKQLTENPPIEISELQINPGEVVFSKLSQGEQFQVTTRYLNDICTYLKNITFFEMKSNQYLKWLCEQQGVDIKAKEKETTEKLKAQMDAQLQASKDKLQNN